MGTRDLFQKIDVKKDRVRADAASSSADDRVAVAAHRLAVRFTDNADLPARYRRRSNRTLKLPKGKEDSDIEKRFKANVESWTRLIETMLAKVEAD